MLLFFTSGLIIVCFCFAFYLIWDQFLKKDSRLSTGLKILRKKTGELEELSIKVENQITKQLCLLKDKTQHFEALVKKAAGLNEKLHQHLNSSPPAPSPGKKEEMAPHPPSSSLKPHFSAKQKLTWLEVVKEEERSPPDEGGHKPDDKVIRFGRSPFTDLPPAP